MEPEVNVSQVNVPDEAVDRRVDCRERLRRRSDRANDTRSRARILVIEHDGRARETLALMLHDHGYEVTLAFSLCLALRRRWPMMPIVAVSSIDEMFDGDLPVNAWLQKPVDPPLLSQVIRDELAPVWSS